MSLNYKITYIYAPLRFRWLPSSEISLEAIEHMREQFPRPKQWPYKAWFMGKVNYHEGIDIQNWSNRQLFEYLQDTRSGISSFGRLKIWVDWFHYLLPDLILRAAKEPDSNLHDEIIEYFLVLYRHELYEEYLSFRRDIFASLATIIMQKSFWVDEKADFLAHCWLEPLEPLQPESNGLALEHIMLFCLKFLIVEDIAEWVESIAVIESKKWHGRFSRWLKDFEKFEDIWNIPNENLETFRQEITKYPRFNS
jgi:hypothetical protein